MPPRNAACRDFLLGILMFKGLTAQRLDTSFGVKGLTQKKSRACTDIRLIWLQTRSPSFYDAGIKKLPIRWQKCIQKGGNYVEK
jgi:hypothetical protein